MTALSRSYYEVMSDVYIPGRWYPGNPLDAQGKIIYKWTFREGKRLDIDEKIFLKLDPPGIPLDFTECGLAAPLVSARVVKLLQELEVQDIQIIPVTVEGHPDEYSILNVTRLIPCVDEARCARVERYTADDAQPPERIGKYRYIGGLRIDPTQVGDARIFRPLDWEMLIVSNDIKEAFEHAQLLGPKYIPV